MSRTTRILGGFSFGYAGQVLITLVGFWLTPFLLSRVGRNEFGLWLVATQIIAYLMLLDLGVVALLPRETAWSTGRAGSVEGAVDLPVIVGKATYVVLLQLPLVAAAALGIWLAMPSMWMELRTPMIWILGSFVLLFPLRILRALLEGLQDLTWIARLQIVAWSLGTVLTVLLVITGGRLSALAAGWVVSQSWIAIGSWIRLRRRFPSVLPRNLPEFRWNDVGFHLKRGAWMSAGQIAQVMINGTDILLIGRILGPTAVVPYVCTAKLITVLANQPQLLMQMAGPALSEISIGGSQQRMLQAANALTHAVLVGSGLLCCVVLAVNHGFVNLWVGPQNYGGDLLTGLVIAATLLRHWNITVGYTILAAGFEKRISMTLITDAIVTVATGALLVSMVGIVGPAIGSIIGVALVSLPGNLGAFRGIVSGFQRTYLKTLWQWFWRFAVATAAALAVARIWKPVTVPAIVGASAVIGITYVLLMLGLILRGPLGEYLRPRIEAFAGGVRSIWKDFDRSEYDRTDISGPR